MLKSSYQTRKVKCSSCRCQCQRRHVRFVDVYRNWFSDALRKAKSTSLWKELVALEQLIEAKDDMGIERALGAIFFSYGGFTSVDDYMGFGQNQAMANVSLNSAISYSKLVRVTNEWSSTRPFVRSYVRSFVHARKHVLFADLLYFACGVCRCIGCT